MSRAQPARPTPPPRGRTLHHIPRPACAPPLALSYLRARRRTLKVRPGGLRYVLAQSRLLLLGRLGQGRLTRQRHLPVEQAHHRGDQEDRHHDQEDRRQGVGVGRGHRGVHRVGQLADHGGGPCLWRNV